MRMIITGLAASLVLGGCVAAGPLAYGPANGSKFGYSEAQIETARYRITYRGSGGSGPDIVERRALRRAAELTLDNGYDWFRVVDRSVEGRERGGVSIGAGVGSGRVGRRGSVGVGVGGDLGTLGATPFYTVRLEILMGNGPRPDDDREIYNARSVINTTRTQTP